MLLAAQLFTHAAAGCSKGDRQRRASIAHDWGSRISGGYGETALRCFQARSPAICGRSCCIRRAGG